MCAKAKIQASFGYPTHFLSTHTSSKPFSCNAASGKLIQTSHKDLETSSIVRLIVEQWTPIPLLPFIQHLTIL